MTKVVINGIQVEILAELPSESSGGRVPVPRATEELLESVQSNPRGMSERMLITRTGTREEPYIRRDGMAMQVMSAHLPRDLIREFKQFCVRLPFPWERNTFVEVALREAMDRYTKGEIPDPPRRPRG